MSLASVKRRLDALEAVEGQSVEHTLPAPGPVKDLWDSMAAAINELGGPRPEQAPVDVPALLDEADAAISAFGKMAGSSVS